MRRLTECQKSEWYNRCGKTMTGKICLVGEPGDYEIKDLGQALRSARNPSNLLKVGWKRNAHDPD